MIKLILKFWTKVSSEVKLLFCIVVACGVAGNYFVLSLSCQCKVCRWYGISESYCISCKVHNYFISVKYLINSHHMSLFVNLDLPQLSAQNSINSTRMQVSCWCLYHCVACLSDSSKYSASMSWTSMIAFAREDFGSSSRASTEVRN